MRRSDFLRWKKAVLAMLVCIVGVFGLAPAMAQSPLLIQKIPAGPPPVATTVSQTIRDWKIICPNPAAQNNGGDVPTRCTMEPGVLGFTRSGKIRRFFGRIVVVKGKPVPVFVIETPLDLLLPAGISFQVDKRKPVKLAFRSCHVDGCLVPFALVPQLLAALRRGIVLKLSVITLSGQKEQAEISLIGFTKALQALQSGTLSAQ